jgi:hypothetical protein
MPNDCDFLSKPHDNGSLVDFYADLYENVELRANFGHERHLLDRTLSCGDTAVTGEKNKAAVNEDTAKNTGRHAAQIVTWHF